MANDPNAILREYLVSIGFDVDKRSLDNAESKIGSAMSSIAEMAGAALEALMGLAAGIGIIDIRLRNLHFTEIQTGSSVANIHALDSAIKSLGGSTASVMGSLSILNAARHNQNFQAKAWAGALGLDMSGDTTKEYLSALPILSKMLANNNPMAGIYASGLGISMDTLYAYNNAPDKDNFLKNYGEVASAASSVDSSGFAQRATNVLSSADRKVALGEVTAAVGADVGNRTALGLDSKVGGLADKALQNIPGLVSGELNQRGYIAGKANNFANRYSVKHSKLHGVLNADTIAQYYMSRGMDVAHASAIAASLMAESSGNPNADPKDGSGSYGFAQWLPNRQAAFSKLYGHDIRNSTDAEQLDFVLQELRGGRGKSQFYSASGARASSDAFTKFFEGPKDLFGQTKRRGDAAVVIYQHNETTINRVADKAKEIGKAVSDAQQATNKVLVTNLQGATR